MTDELIARLESADGPSRELDAEIAAAVRYFPKNVGFVWKNDLEPNCPEVGRVTCVTGLGTGGPHYESPRYTASIDTALTLVPDGCGATVDTRRPPAAIVQPDDGRIGKEWTYAATPALALAAAALKARGV